ncbi:HlyD family secretion protein [Plastoroseomonas hellenica]|uniref:HlyD family secretion protein n=1 Tax=Plastoroseomonas hellenica TaxID=2687306 RepID=A0ABS5EVS4_9PROT|nr:HlyD family secretion protein [Plastoroseomonas hellenica]MBR0643929.1 HlyD family secretion protein [Plastoroseomonas hellenica]MBR0664065.1 HlyD family secretion protein [Plastoroseomonas hellenica]
MNAPTPNSPAETLGSTTAPPRRRFLRIAILLAVVLILAFGGNWWFRVGRYMESTDNAYVQGDIAQLSARIEGDVAELLVADNQTVEAGQPLIRLEERDWRARRDSAAAALAQAEAGIATTRAQIGQQRAQIASADAQVTQAEAERIRAIADATRYGSLAQSGFGSRENAERTLADRRKAEASEAAARAAADAARAQLPVLEAQLATAEGRRAEAAAQLSLAENNLSYTLIRAPFAGVAGNRTAQIGAHVMPGQNLIAVAQPPSRQWVTANFKETQLVRMHPGQPVTLTLDAGGHELRGTVLSLAPATGALFSLLPPENATGNFTKIVQRVPVRIALAPGQDPSVLRPGLSVEARVDTRDDPNAPTGFLAAAAAAIGLGR